MDKPGGQVAPALGDLLIGDAIPNALPKPILLHRDRAAALGVAEAHAISASRSTPIGSDFDSARSVGVRTRFVQFLVYVIGGGCYGLAGVFISAQTGSGDPLDRQSDAAADVRRRRRRRHAARRRARRPARLGVRRLCPDDGRQHPAGAERLGLLFDGRRRLDPDPRGARRFGRARTRRWSAIFAASGAAQCGRGGKDGCPSQRERDAEAPDASAASRAARIAAMPPTPNFLVRNAEALRYRAARLCLLRAGRRGHAARRSATR